MIADAGRVLGRVVAAICNVFNPDTVVVGGDLGEAGDLLLDPMREAVGRYAIAPAAEDARIVAGVLGERAQVLGALALALLQSEHLAARLAPHPLSHPTRRNDVKFRGRGEAPGAGRRSLALAVPRRRVRSTTTATAASSSSSSGEQARPARSRCCCRTRKSSVRWETVDRPFLKQAFDAAGVKSHDPERRGRQVDAAAAGRAGDHERREGAPAREPRLGLRRGDRGERASRRASRSSTTTA